MAAVIQIHELREHLAAGRTLTECAEIFGVTASAITQAVDNHSLTGTGGLAAKHLLLDESYDALEQSVLGRLEQSSRMLLDPMKLCRILQTVNSAKRRGGPLQQDAATVNNHVTLVLPALIQNRITMSDRREVVSVDGRDMVTMPALQVKSMLSGRDTTAIPLPAVTKLGELI